VLVVPLQTGGTMLGTLFLRTLRPHTIPQEAVAFCQAAAEIACRSLVNARLFEHVRAERDELLLHKRPAGLAAEAQNHLHLNLTAEALGIVTLISGYAELLLDPRDAGQLDVRQVRALALLQEQASYLEQLVRMMQLVNGRHSQKEGSAREILQHAVQEVRPLLHGRKFSVQVTAGEDFLLHGRERWHSFFVCLLREIAQREQDDARWTLHVDQAQVAIRRQGGAVASPQPAWPLWREVAAVLGGDLSLPEGLDAAASLRFAPPGQVFD